MRSLFEFPVTGAVVRNTHLETLSVRRQLIWAAVELHMNDDNLEWCMC